MTVVVALSVEKKKAYKRKRDTRPGPCRWADLRDTAKSDPRLPSVTLWVSCTPRQNIRKFGDTYIGTTLKTECGRVCKPMGNMTQYWPSI